MWLWVGLGWCGLAFGIAALLHRLRRTVPRHPPEVAAFALRLENELSAAHPDVKFLGLLPDRFACLLRVDGQETPVGLYEAFRRAEPDDDAFSRLVARLVADVREVGLDRVEDLDFATAAALLLPQIRSREWLEARGTFGDAGLVATPLNDELVIVYVVDEPSCMVFVCREHARRWQKSAADLHNLALANLSRLGAVGAAGDAPVLLQSGDGFDASRVLLLQQSDGLLVALPERDTLWFGPDGGEQQLESLMAATEAIAERSPHPVSKRVYRVTAGRLEPVSGQH